jgi:hypothetical protein
VSVQHPPVYHNRLYLSTSVCIVQSSLHGRPHLNSFISNRVIILKVTNDDQEPQQNSDALTPVLHPILASSSLSVPIFRPPRPQRRDSSPASTRNDSFIEHSEILCLGPCSHVLVLPRRLRFPNPESPILVSRPYVLLYSFVVCFIRSYRKYSITNRWKTNSFTMDYWSVIC